MMRIFLHLRNTLSLLLVCGLFFVNISFAEDGLNKNSYPIDPGFFQSLKWRDIGPFRGGRSCTVAGVTSQPYTFYLGTTGGGVWKTKNAGASWENISDGFFNTTTIGSIDVSESDPNVVYVGTGESPPRGMKISHGDGVYKSTDAGKTWKHIGLRNTRQISRVRIHPKNPDVVYVAAQGNIWGPNKERGVYKTTDGGKTWKLVLFVDENSGAVDLSMNMSNPRILYAAMWDYRRKPWYVKSGGKGSGIYKSIDGGDSWEKLTQGLPEEMGKVGIDISQSNPDKVYALVETKEEESGLYKSDDGGKSFRLINDTKNIVARPWYYMHIIADPQNENIVNIMNYSFLKSIDGGKTFTTVNSCPGYDHHALWINPENTTIIINGSDAGGTVSLDDGKSWSILLNQPTAQIYRVFTDNKYPYRVYFSQQDQHPTISLPSRSFSRGIGVRDWIQTGGGESGHIAFNPDNPELVYATGNSGNITEWTRSTKRERDIIPFPEYRYGTIPGILKYRANWNAPIILSPHDYETIYYGTQMVLKSTNRGVTWEEISPDLTRNNKDRQGPGGFPFTNEQAGGENYNTLFYLAESALEKGVIWAGTDDGLIHITRDGGKSWENVTPKGMGEWQVNTIETSPFDPGTAYIAVTGYKMNDFHPHIYKTENYGESWDELVEGLPDDTFVRVVRTDPDRKGLLYAGTETGMFVSFDDRGNWQPFQLNLPEVPITDLSVRQGDLVAATQGRGIWILDDLSPLHQINETVMASDYHLFQPRDAYRPFNNPTWGSGMGENPPEGVMINYIIKSKLDDEVEVTLEILDNESNVIRTFTKDLLKKQGANQWEWNMRTESYTYRYPEITSLGGVSGYTVIPGVYKVRLKIGDYSKTQVFNIKVNPLLKVKNPDYKELADLSSALHEATSDMLKSIDYIRSIKKQINMLIEVTKSDIVKENGGILKEKLDTWDNQILQSKFARGGSMIRYDSKLFLKTNNLLKDLNRGDLPINNGIKEVSKKYLNEWQALKVELEKIKNEDIKEFNKKMKLSGFPILFLQ